MPHEHDWKLVTMTDYDITIEWCRGCGTLRTNGQDETPSDIRPQTQQNPSEPTEP